MAHSKKKQAKNLGSQSSRQNKKQKKKQKTISLILVFFMLGSLVAIGLSSIGGNNEDGMKYGDYKFSVELVEGTTDQYVVVTRIDKEDIFFYTLPKDALTIPIEGNLTETLEKAQIILMTSNPLDEAASYYDLIRYDLSTFSNKQIVGATTEFVEGIELPILTCANATNYTPVVTMTVGNESAITINGACIYVSFTQGDVAPMRDRLLYSLLGIIKE